MPVFWTQASGDAVHVSPTQQGWPAAPHAVPVDVVVAAEVTLAVVAAEVTLTVDVAAMVAPAFPSLDDTIVTTVVAPIVDEAFAPPVPPNPGPLPPVTSPVLTLPPLAHADATPTTQASEITAAESPAMKHRFKPTVAPSPRKRDARRRPGSHVMLAP